MRLPRDWLSSGVLYWGKSVHWSFQIKDDNRSCLFRKPEDRLMDFQGSSFKEDAMAHVFNPALLHRLDDPNRLDYQNPLKLVEKMHPHPNTSMMDFGAGAGYFTFPIAKSFPENSPVHVIDIQKEMLDHLIKRAKDQDLSGRIQPHLLETFPLSVPDGSVGLAWMVNVFHEIDDRKSALSEIFRILAPGASLFIVDWKPEETPMGPPLSERVPEVEIITSLLEAGFALIRSWEIYSMHLVVEAQKGLA